jgi:pimeloyl-ACP methyl ester carboxylesterase
VKNQFFISGLGADERVFSKLGDLGANKVFIEWLTNHDNESLHSYSQRLIDEYNIQQGDLLVGLSFGGLIAQQIAEILGMKTVILISSFRTKEDLKMIFNKGLTYRLHKLIPNVKSDLVANLVANFLNSGTASSRSIISEMVQSTDMSLMNWSIEKIYQQDTELAPGITKVNLIGSKDRIVKPWHNDTTHLIEGGSHFMVYEHAEIVSGMIRELV